MSLTANHETIAQPVDILPVAGNIGAEVRGVRVSPALDQDTLQVLYDALLKHKVLFIRGQHHLNDADQEAFARRLGTPVSHPTVPSKPGTDYIFELDSTNHGGRANSWHTDISFVDAYPKISILRAVVIPPAGGDTVWANTAAAYAALPEHLRHLADRLWALHTNDYDYAAYHINASEGAIRRHKEVFSSTIYQTEHPVVQVHPETGERTLLLGHFVKKILGVSSADSARLFSIFQDYITRLENTVRWRWAAGDVVIWDNRATQHYAVNDYGASPRIVRRVTVKGEVPVSVDGKRSVALPPVPRS